MILADPGVAIQTAWMTDAGTVLCRPPRCRVYPDLKMVPEVQGGMLAPPFMDHRMTSELGLMRTNCRTHARHGVKHCSSGNGLRQMIQD